MLTERGTRSRESHEEAGEGVQAGCERVKLPGPGEGHRKGKVCLEGSYDQEELPRNGVREGRANKA